MGKLIAVIAATGQGKTLTVKKLTATGKLYVFDVQNEYRELPDDINVCPRMRNVNLDMSTFLDTCTNRIRGYNVVCEEATGFFSGNIGKKAIRVFLSKRHQKHNYLLIFHSINAIPLQILQFIDMVILFKTNDERQHVEKKYPRFLPYFDKVQKEKEIPNPAPKKPIIQPHVIFKLL